MIKDPHFEREQAKYENPIPSREFILDYLRSQTATLTRDQIADALKIQDDEQYEGLRRRLRAMERDGELIFTRGQRYGLPERMDLLSGTVLGHRDGFGFFRPDEGGDDLYISARDMQMYFHGDKVLAQKAGTGGKGRRDARIVRLLQERTAALVGRFYVDCGMSFVIADDKRITQEILIEPHDRFGARHGDIVVIELVRRPSRYIKAAAKVTEVLGEHQAPGMEIEIALRNYDLPHQWPAVFEKKLRRIGSEVSEADKQNRVDLRELPLVTIDGEDARDFDDAVYAETKKSGGWRLWVAIADVSHYVRTGSALDIEAKSRGNSVYFPSQVIPMLPEELSNGLCSLNPLVDRLCMVAEMTVSAKGALSGFKFYPAVMHSKARFTYTEVAAMLEGEINDDASKQALLPNLNVLHDLYQCLDKVREQRGAIAFETLETQFIFNEQRKIESIVPRARNVAHKIIEECMILANVAAAKFVKRHKGEVLYRVHDAPSEQKITQFRDFLKERGLTLGGGLEPEPIDFQLLLEEVAERPDAELIQVMLLRTMRQATYTPDNQGHFGLALEGYSHFTSPIRRYPDLVLHRVIRYLLSKDQLAAQGDNPNDKWTPEGGYHYSIEELDELGESCSNTERRADEATRDVSDWLKCEFMQDHVGDVFDGVIASVTNFGLFVRLDKLFIDGLVHISSIGSDYYQYDPARQRLIGEASKQVYQLGDSITVKVASVNLDDRQIDLVIVGDEGRSRRRSNKPSTPRARLTKAMAASEAAKPDVEISSRRFVAPEQSKTPKKKGKFTSKSSAKKSKSNDGFKFDKPSSDKKKSDKKKPKKASKKAKRKIAKKANKDAKK